jgi:hypothetical protein
MISNTKKGLLSLSFTLFIFYIVSYYNKFLSLPAVYKDFCCFDDRIFNLFLISVPILVFSIFVNFLQKNYIDVWGRFTKIYLVVYLLLYFTVPTQGDGMIWFQRETISFFGSIIYTLISIIILVYKSFKKD